jgi:hypothetical protein
VTTTTTPVKWMISSRLGQATLRSSLMISMKKRGRQLRRPADPEPPSRRGAARPALERDRGRTAALAPLPSLACLPECRLTERLLMLLPQRLNACLPGLPVRTMGTAARTVLTQFDTIRIVAPVLLRAVIPGPALRAGQVYHYPIFLLCHVTPLSL